MVAREGSAPPTSGCRPDVMLFHHRAGIGCRGWNRTSIRAFKGRRPTIRRPGMIDQNENGRWRIEDRKDWWIRYSRSSILHPRRTKWRNAVDSHHLPEGTHSLAPRPGSLGRLTFQNGLPSRSSKREGWSAWQDLHLQPFRLERNASSLGYTRLVPTVGVAPTLDAF